jgi:hypothetical protein
MFVIYILKKIVMSDGDDYGDGVGNGYYGDGNGDYGNGYYGDGYYGNISEWDAFCIMVKSGVKEQVAEAMEMIETNPLDPIDNLEVVECLAWSIRNNSFVEQCMEMLMFHCGCLGRAKILELLIENPQYMTTDMLIRVNDPVFLENIVVIQTFHLTQPQPRQHDISKCHHRRPNPIKSAYSRIYP